MNNIAANMRMKPNQTKSTTTMTDKINTQKRNSKSRSKYIQ